MLIFLLISVIITWMLLLCLLSLSVGIESTTRLLTCAPFLLDGGIR